MSTARLTNSGDRNRLEPPVGAWGASRFFTSKPQYYGVGRLSRRHRHPYIWILPGIDRSDAGKGARVEVFELLQPWFMSDPGIKALSRKANEEQAACPVTLIVSGSLVTGHVVSRSTFEADTERMVEMARKRAGDEDGAVEALGDLIGAMNEEIGTHDNNEFVHVSVQEVMTGAEAIHLGGSVFRFRTSEIEGYTIGTVETKEA